MKLLIDKWVADIAAPTGFLAPTIHVQLNEAGQFKPSTRQRAEVFFRTFWEERHVPNDPLSCHFNFDHYV